MTADKHNLLPLISQLSQSNEDIEVLWLYGSRATGPSRPDSDYDLAIAFKNFIKDPLESRLRPEELAIDWANELQVPENVISIIDLNLSPIPLAWEVISKGKEIFVRDKYRLAIEIQRISSMYELDILHHRKYYG